MDATESRSLLDSMNEIYSFFAGLDLDKLPALSSVMVTKSARCDGRLTGKAMIKRFGQQLECIDDVRAWAAELGGDLELGEESDPGTDYASRKLSAIIPLPEFGYLEVWTRLYDLHPAPGWSPDPALALA